MAISDVLPKNSKKGILFLLKESGFTDKEALELAITIQAMIEGAYALMVSHQYATAMQKISE